MTKLHESHTKDRFTHDCFRTQTDQELDLCEPWTNMDKWLWKCYHISKIFHRSNDKWDPDSPKGSQAFCGVCVQPRNPLFLSLITHTDAQAHIFFHMGKSLALSHLDNKEFLSLFSTTLSLWAVCWPHLTSSLGRHQNKTKHLGCSS